MNEFELINTIKKKQLSSSIKSQDIIGIGDDCAIIPISNTEVQAISVDTYNENIHFSFNYMNAQEIAIRSLLASISDISAMAIKCSQILVSITIPKNGINLASTMMDAIIDKCESLGILIIGGDTTSGEYFSLSFTVIGYSSPNKVKLRSMALINDDIYITGTIGYSLAGLNLLLQNKIPSTNAEIKAISKHKLPICRQKEAFTLSSFNEVHSMIDISDGLISELNHISDQSNIDYKLNLDKNHLSKDIKDLAKTNKMTAEQLFLSSGEEYELLFTVQKGFIPPFDATKIGFMTNLGNGERKSLSKIAKGYEHNFSSI